MVEMDRSAWLEHAAAAATAASAAAAAVAASLLRRLRADAVMLTPAL